MSSVPEDHPGVISPQTPPTSLSPIRVIDRRQYRNPGRACCDTVSTPTRAKAPSSREIGGTTVGDQDEWGQGDATEMGATVQPPTRYVYRYRCNSCGAVGQNWDSESEAQSDGLQHEQSMHPRLYTVEAVGTHD
jgi:hypothetical protein